MRPGVVSALLIVGPLLVAQGCATTGPPPLASEHMAQLASGSDVTVVHYPTPPFRRVHPQTAAGWSAIPLLGLVAGPVAEAASAQRGLEVGEQVRVQLGLDDPVKRVHERLVAGLASTPRFRLLPTAPARFLSHDAPSELRATLGSGLVLDFRTISWGIVAATKFLPGTTHQYQAFYGVRVRVVRLPDSGVVWQAGCTSVGRNPKGKWTHEELTADDGRLLKSKLNEAADACADQLVAQLTGREARP